MASPITMPQLGETVVEGTITRWLKKEGDTVERDEPLFEISTDKVDTEVPSPLAGKLVEIKVQEGETVNVGTELALIDAGGDGQEAAAAGDGKASASPEERAAPQSEEVAPEGAGEEPKEPSEAEASGDVDAQSAPHQAAAAPEQDRAPDQDGARKQESAPRQEGAPAGGGPRSGILSPLVRRLADEHQIDLSQVQGTGTGGRITKKDVQGYLQTRSTPSEDAEPQAAPGPQPQPALVPQPQPVTTPQPQPAMTASGGGREEAIPLTRMRQAIAKHMVQSIQTSARAWNLVEVDMENVVRTRQAAKDDFRAREGVGLTYMPFVARSVCEALLAFPDVNSELRDDQLIVKRYVNLGIAVALDDGLIVPVVKGADAMNIVGLSRAINHVATRARSKKLSPDDVHGGTFTITNPGPFGSIISVPIINQPQCAILAFDSVEKRPVVIDDAIAIRHMVYLSMSWDHRIIDGATAAKFLARLKANLETWDFGPEVGVAARGAAGS
ncbi:2-oxoglutarate dehydrogenase, E2 component, dihydrolipoamide succinyltransferase [soil metagenome]